MAVEGQPTLVYFLDGRCAADALEESRRRAERVSVATGGRVLTVACRQEATQSLSARAERGITAYAWLIGEGTDVDVTVFMRDSANAALLSTVRVMARTRDLPLPARDLAWR